MLFNLILKNAYAKQESSKELEMEMEKDLKNANKKVQDLTTQNQRMLADFESNLVWW